MYGSYSVVDRAGVVVLFFVCVRSHVISAERSLPNDSASSRRGALSGAHVIRWLSGSGADGKALPGKGPPQGRS